MTSELDVTVPRTPLPGGAAVKMDRYLPPQHRLSKIHRIGAALFGLGLVVFGTLGFTHQLSFFSTQGQMVLGLSSNGLLSTISVVVGVGLMIAAGVGGAVASSTTAAAGGLFVLSGLLNLAVLNTSYNLLAFKGSNVAFSLVAGMALLFFGLYGRVSGGLTEDNPFWRARHHQSPEPHTAEEDAADLRRIAEIDTLAQAELAVAEGHPTPEQERRVREDAAFRSQAARRAAYQRQQADEERRQQL